MIGAENITYGVNFPSGSKLCWRFYFLKALFRFLNTKDERVQIIPAKKCTNSSTIVHNSIEKSITANQSHI